MIASRGRHQGLKGVGTFSVGQLLTDPGDRAGANEQGCFHIR